MNSKISQQTVDHDELDYELPENRMESIISPEDIQQPRQKSIAKSESQTSVAGGCCTPSSKSSSSSKKKKDNCHIF
jgi:hypothetical protein